MVDDIHYFSCKENLLFVPSVETNIMITPENDSNVSTVLAKDFSEKMPVFFNERMCNLPVLPLSDDLLPALAKISSDKTVLNHSYTILKENKLSLIVEETFDSIQNLEYVDLSSSNCRHSFIDEKSEFAHQDCEGNYDSDDSLGILPFDKFCSFDMNMSLERNQPELNKTFDNINSIIDEEYAFLHEHQDFSKVYPTLVCKTLDKPDAVINNFSSCEENLNTTVILTNSPVESRTIERQSVIQVMASSPVYSLSNASFTRNDGSPNYVPDSPNVYASTPKHEINYSYVIEDDALCLAQNSFVGHLNKTISKAAVKSKKLAFSQHKPDLMCTSPITATVLASTDKNKELETNILKVTSNLSKTLDINPSHNKTFNNLNETCILPVVQDNDEPHINKFSINSQSIDDTKGLETNVLNVTCNLPKSLDVNLSHSKTFSNLNKTCVLPVVKDNDEPQSLGVKKTKCKPMHECPKDLYAVASDFHLYEEQEVFEDQIILNKTCDLVKVSDSNAKRLENRSSEGILNTTVSLPEGLEDFNPENITMNNKAVALNTTFEKLEESNLLANANPLDSSKDCMPKYNKTKEFDLKSKSQKTIQFSRSDSLKVASRNEGTTFDKKIVLRKSVGCFRKADISGLLNKKSQRRSVGCFGKTDVSGSVDKQSQMRSGGYFAKTDINGPVEKPFQRNGVGSFSADDCNGVLNKLPTNKNAFASNTCISSKKYITTKSSFDNRMFARHVSANMNKAICNKKSKENLSADNTDKELYSETFSKSGESHAKNSIKIHVGCRPETLLNETIRLPTSIPNIGKTVVKKSKVLNNFKSSPEMNKFPKYKIESKTKIPSGEKKYSRKDFSSSENKLAQKSCQNNLLSKPNRKLSFVRTSYQEESHMETRPSEKCVLSHKNIPRCMSSGADNLCRPQRAISGVEFDPSSTWHMPFRSRIPSISQNSIKQDIRVKSRLKASGKECTIRKVKGSSLHNLK